MLFPGRTEGNLHPHNRNRVSHQGNGRTYILETTHKQRHPIYPLEAIQERYHPWYSVDEASRTYRFLPVVGRGVISEK
jgi:hypothetical protein